MAEHPTAESLPHNQTQSNEEPSPSDLALAGVIAALEVQSEQLQKLDNTTKHYVERSPETDSGKHDEKIAELHKMLEAVLGGQVHLAESTASRADQQHTTLVEEIAVLRLRTTEATERETRQLELQKQVEALRRQIDELRESEDISIHDKLQRKEELRAANDEKTQTMEQVKEVKARLLQAKLAAEQSRQRSSELEVEMLKEKAARSQVETELREQKAIADKRELEYKHLYDQVSSLVRHSGVEYRIHS